MLQLPQCHRRRQWGSGRFKNLPKVVQIHMQEIWLQDRPRHLQDRPLCSSTSQTKAREARPSVCNYKRPDSFTIFWFFRIKLYVLFLISADSPKIHDSFHRGILNQKSLLPRWLWGPRGGGLDRAAGTRGCRKPSGVHASRRALPCGTEALGMGFPAGHPSAARLTVLNVFMGCLCHRVFSI